MLYTNRGPQETNSKIENCLAADYQGKLFHEDCVKNFLVRLKNGFHK